MDRRRECLAKAALLHCRREERKRIAGAGVDTEPPGNAGRAREHEQFSALELHRNLHAVRGGFARCARAKGDRAPLVVQRDPQRREERRAQNAVVNELFRKRHDVCRQLAAVDVARGEIGNRRGGCDVCARRTRTRRCRRAHWKPQPFCRIGAQHDLVCACVEQHPRGLAVHLDLDARVNLIQLHRQCHRLARFIRSREDRLACAGTQCEGGEKRWHGVASG